MEDNYSKAYKEVMEILNYVPQESVNKIPKTMIDTFKTKMDVNYDFQVDINKSFEEQELLDETKAIFANIFRDYWATPYQKERIEEKEKYDRQQNEKEKLKKYNTNDIFKNNSIKRKNISDLENMRKENLPNNYKENFFNRIIGFFKKRFYIN